MHPRGRAAGHHSHLQGSPVTPQLQTSLTQLHPAATLLRFSLSIRDLYLEPALPDCLAPHHQEPPCLSVSAAQGKSQSL